MQHQHNPSIGFDASPTTPSPDRLAGALERNIEALVQRRRADAKSASLEHRAADAITRFAGNMRFAYLHAMIFGLWIAINLGWVSLLPPWDPTLVVLAMLASVEAIFLSTFVLISQNRMAAENDKRADLDLQISLLNEHETTKLIALVSAIAAKLNVQTDVDSEVAELKQDVAPEAVLDRLASGADAE
jgi:uncharacterized membrane protein